MVVPPLFNNFAWNNFVGGKIAIYIHLLHLGGGEVPPNKLIEVPWRSRDPWINIFIKRGGGPLWVPFRGWSFFIHPWSTWRDAEMSMRLVVGSPLVLLNFPVTFPPEARGWTSQSDPKLPGWYSQYQILWTVIQYLCVCVQSVHN